MSAFVKRRNRADSRRLRRVRKLNMRWGRRVLLANGWEETPRGFVMHIASVVFREHAPALQWLADR